MKSTPENIIKLQVKENISITCEFCGAVFYRESAFSTLGRPKRFCSKSCFRKWISSIPEEQTPRWLGPWPTCPTCGVRLANRKVKSCKHHPIHRKLTKQEEALRVRKISLTLAGTVPQNKCHHPGRYSNVHRGWFRVGKRRFYFKSNWEANYAFYLEFLKGMGEIKQWDYEVQTFWFEKIRRGIRSYRPDFRVVTKNGQIEFHEVKGWMDSQSATKIKRMRIYHPEVRLIVVDRKAYQDIKGKVGKMLNFL